MRKTRYILSDSFESIQSDLISKCEDGGQLCVWQVISLVNRQLQHSR